MSIFIAKFVAKNYQIMTDLMYYIVKHLGVWYGTELFNTEIQHNNNIETVFN